VILFIATLLSATFTYGVLYRAAGWPPNIGRALLFSVPLMAILLCHEMGHYVMARRYSVPATLPYFIPFPISIFGTLGAVIRMQGRIYSRRALFDIGIAGPLAGLVIAIPACFVGLRLSTNMEIAEMPAGAPVLGEPILFELLGRWAMGDLPEGQVTVLHPLALAGWAGLFVTAFNLIPMGQLDGGHVSHALFPRKSHIIGWATFAALLLAATRYYWWAILAVLILVLGGPRHPPVGSYDDLGRWRFGLGLLGLALFVLTFTPEPFGYLR
jgi:membrane-associated protease RseP (regulator of RpoE activity)